MRKVHTGAWLLILGAVFYSSFITEAALGYPVNPAHGYLSELAAREQETSLLFRATDSIAGILFIIVGILFLSFQRDISADAGRAMASTKSGGAGHSKIAGIIRYLRQWPLVSVGLIIAGIATILDAIFPLDCAETLTECASRVEAGEVSISHNIHAVTSSLAGTGIIVVAVGVLVSATFQKMTVARIFAAVSLLLLVLQMLEMVVHLPIGITQRLHVVSVVAMFLTLGIGVLRSGADHFEKAARINRNELPGSQAVR